MNTLADLLKYIDNNTAQSNTNQMGLLSDLWKGFNNNSDNQKTVDAMKGMFGLLPGGPGDVASGLLAADDVRRGDFLSAGLNGVGVLPYVPALGGILRGADTGLPYEVLVDVNKGRGMLSKAQRQTIASKVANVSENQQQYSTTIQKIGQLNSDLNNLRNGRISKGYIEPQFPNDELVLRRYRRGLLGDYGVVGDAAEILKTTPASVSQSYDSAFRYKNQLDAFNKSNHEKDILYQAKRKVFGFPMASLWHKTMSDKINNNLMFNAAMGNLTSSRYMREINPLIDSANLEAVTREAKKRGIKIDYISAKSKMQGGSHYLTRPNGEVVRISDHELPDTPQREYNRSLGLNGRWNDEVLIGDYRNSSIDEILDRVINGYKDN